MKKILLTAALGGIFLPMQDTHGMLPTKTPRTTNITLNTGERRGWLNVSMGDIVLYGAIEAVRLGAYYYLLPRGTNHVDERELAEIRQRLGRIEETLNRVEQTTNTTQRNLDDFRAQSHNEHMHLDELVTALQATAQTTNQSLAQHIESDHAEHADLQQRLQAAVATLREQITAFNASADEKFRILERASTQLTVEIQEAARFAQNADARNTEAHQKITQRLEETDQHATQTKALAETIEKQIQEMHTRLAENMRELQKNVAAAATKEQLAQVMAEIGKASKTIDEFRTTLNDMHGEFGQKLEVFGKGMYQTLDLQKQFAAKLDAQETHLAQIEQKYTSLAKDIAAVKAVLDGHSAEFSALRHEHASIEQAIRSSAEKQDANVKTVKQDLMDRLQELQDSTHRDIYATTDERFASSATVTKLHERLKRMGPSIAGQVKGILDHSDESTPSASPGRVSALGEPATAADIGQQLASIEKALTELQTPAPAGPSNSASPTKD